MEPRIRYATTSDGVRIAYAMSGTGPYLVLVANPTTRAYFDDPNAVEDAWERFSRSFTFITYYGRGMGLSQRDVLDFSLEARVADLEAVVDNVQSSTHALIASGQAGPTAIAYAARHPEKVTHLILWTAAACPRDQLSTPEARGLVALSGQNWDLFLDTFAHVVYGWSEAQSKDFARSLRKNITLQVWRQYFLADRQIDTTHLLSQIAVPTLIVRPREASMYEDTSRELAARIPNARLQLIDGASSGYSAQNVPIFEEFIGVKPPDVPPVGELPSGTAIILFADVADSTGLTERLGDAAFRTKARDLDGALRLIIREHSGTCIDAKTLGDGVLAQFSSARHAVKGALACGEAGSRAGLPLHLGLHAGDVIREEGNVYGGAVNIASRISGLSAPGEVLVSETVRSLARTSAGVPFEDRGEQALKGVGEPVRVWAVLGGESG